MPKEDRSDWVAVNPEFSSGSLTTKIRPATSAYQFFQKEVTPSIKAELLSDGSAFSVAALSKAISDRWSNLDEDEKRKYEDLAREDSYRFQRESHQADIAALERREKLRREREEVILDDDAGGRGGRRKTRGQREKEKKKDLQKEKKQQELRKKLYQSSKSGSSNNNNATKADDVLDDDSSFHDDDEDDSSSSGSYNSEDDDSDDSDSSGSDDDKDSDSDGDGSDKGSDQSYRERKKKIKKKKKKKKSTKSSKKKAKPVSTRKVSQKQVEYREKMRQDKKVKEDYIEERQEDLRKERAQQAKKRLDFLLKQSSIFKHFGAVKEDKAKFGLSVAAASTATAMKTSSVTTEEGEERTTPSTTEAAAAAASHSRRELMDDKQSTIREQLDAQDLDDGEERQATFLTAQPSTLGHGKMREYQVEGLNWMIRLQENGVNGILADEMGLGKTLQSISILVYMLEYRNCTGPHLIVVPKSTLSNWMMELSKWAPTLKAVKFHGTKEEREDCIKNVLQPGQRDEFREWNVLVTTYEICNIEQAALKKFAWSYLIIDEAHRLKNETSAFSKTIRTVETRYRILLTGTPLQNSLHELWALLNFLVPDVFASAEQFDEWFNLDIEDNVEKNKLISQLHKILRPFMLRRLKADVETSLPPKHETILFTGMSSMQKKLYKDILIRDIDAIQGGGKNAGSRTAILNIVMQLRKCAGHPYLFPGVEDRSLPPLGEHLVENCGKMVLLDKLLKRLRENGHRVLLFTQMTRILDIMEDYLVMRRFPYCRIDGNTSYDDREDFIDSFNAPNSEKFIFLLSTRAGGLGINLQTADVVILYDSDWNPQADLQAQDRAHRIGQKKPVQIFRFVTEHTIEEKIVERAQQKLKLDAMVVQQGRLKEKENKLSRDDLLEAVRFGADKIFKSKDSSITDDDIDIILSAGKKKTEELNEKLKSADKGDLLDFKLDGSSSGIQTFEGVDYSSSALAQAKANAELLGIIDIGKRERRPVANYNENMLYQQQIAALQGTSVPKPKKKKEMRLPKHLRLPRMEEWQMYDRETLQQIQEEEEAAFHALPEEQQKLFSIKATPPTPTSNGNQESNNNDTTPSVVENAMDTSIDTDQQNDDNPETPTAADNATSTMEEVQLPPLLSDEKQALKEKLLAEGFGHWKRIDFNAFIKASARYGRNNIAKITIDFGGTKSDEEIQRFAKAFWDESIGKKRFTENEYDRVVKIIEKGEKKIDEKEGLQRGTQMLISLFDNPWEELEFTYTNCKDKCFTAEEDRHLLCWTHKYGYGQWHAIKMAIRRSPAFRFDYFLRSLPVEQLGRRCEQLMQAAKKEVENMERRAREEMGESAVVSQKNDGAEEFRIMQKQIRLATKSKVQTQRRQLELKVQELEIEIQKIHDRLKHVNDFGRHSETPSRDESRQLTSDNENQQPRNTAEAATATSTAAAAAAAAAAATGDSDKNDHHGSGEDDANGALDDENGAVGADGEYVKFPDYDGTEPPKEWKKAFTHFCNGTRREVKESLDPRDRKNKHMVNGILKDRWLDLTMDEKKYWRKWASWDKKRFDRDTAIFQKTSSNRPSQPVDNGGSEVDIGNDNDLVIPKKRKGESSNSNEGGLFSTIPKKKNRH